MIVTIDGPAGTGKSTVAKLLAKKLGFSFFDTGAMYRAFSWWVRFHQIDMRSLIETSPKQLEIFPFEIIEDNGGKKYLVGGRDVTEEIRCKDITEDVSKISAVKEIRELLLPLQRDYALHHDVVFEGRDLGTVVFPQADVKFFLTASPEIRAWRRYQEMIAKDPHTPLQFEEVKNSLQQRDEQDATREIAPLRCPEDATIVDTTALSIEEVVEILSIHVLERK